MVNEPKRISILEDDGTTLAGEQSSSRFGPGTGTIIRRLTNYHNIWFGFSAVPLQADANASGTWVLWNKLNASEADTIWSLANILTDNFTMQIIACGVWRSSNQTPYNFVSQLKSSRNFVANQELVMTVHVHSVTTGSVAILTSLCAGVAVK